MKYYGILLIAILILLGACDIKSPVKPKWDVELAIPLINEKYYVSDLVDSVNILADDNNVLYLTSNGAVSTPTFGVIPFTPPPNASAEDVPVYKVNNIPPLSMPFEDQAGKVQFSYAKIATGALKTKFTSLVAGSSVTLTFANLYNADNSPFVIHATHTTSLVTWDLAGCHFGVSGSSAPFAALNFSVVAESPAAANTHIGDLSLLANEPMGFEEIQGKIIDFTLGLQDNIASIDIDYPQDLNQSVTLESASIIIELNNQVGFGAAFSGQFYALNEAGEEITVPIKDDQGQDFQAIPGLNSFVVSESISDLLSIMPTHIEIRNGLFTINTGAQTGSVSAADYIDLSYIINAPFIFTLHANDIVIQKEVAIAISSVNAERVKKNALGATLKIYALNKLPVGATATAYFSSTPNIDVNDSTSYDYTKVATIQSSEVIAGEQPPVEITLTESDIKLFGNTHVYLRWKFSFFDSGHPITIHGSTADYIQIKSMLYTKIAVDGL
ncbi:hypothetical protein MASR2M64_01190 [Candidatus Cloacimonadota bacterium]